MPNENKWRKIYEFQFEDVEYEEVKSLYEMYKGEEDKISDWAKIISEKQAQEIANILINNQHNVIVHCKAGVSRSGAVTEAAIILDYKVYEFSNLRTINKTVFNRIKQYIPKYKLFLFYLKKFF